MRDQNDIDKCNEISYTSNTKIMIDYGGIYKINGILNDNYNTLQPSIYNLLFYVRESFY